MNRYKVSMSKTAGEQGERAWFSKQNCKVTGLTTVREPEVTVTKSTSSTTLSICCCSSQINVHVKRESVP